MLKLSILLAIMLNDHTYDIKEREMTHSTTSLQRNKPHSGYNWTIMALALPCSYIARSNEAMSENLEGRDYHFLK